MCNLCLPLPHTPDSMLIILSTEDLTIIRMHIIMCIRRCINVRTNIFIDENLLKEAFALSNAKTKKELINHALEEFVKNNKRKNLADLKGKIAFNENYDYRKMREGIE